MGTDRMLLTLLCQRLFLKGSVGQASSIKTPVAIFAEMGKQIVTIIRNCKAPRIDKPVLKHESHLSPLLPEPALTQRQHV